MPSAWVTSLRDGKQTTIKITKTSAGGNLLLLTPIFLWIVSWWTSFHILCLLSSCSHEDGHAFLDGTLYPLNVTIPPFSPHSWQFLQLLWWRKMFVSLKYQSSGSQILGPSSYLIFWEHCSNSFMSTNMFIIACYRLMARWNNSTAPSGMPYSYLPYTIMTSSDTAESVQDYPPTHPPTVPPL